MLRSFWQLAHRRCHLIHHCVLHIFTIFVATLNSSSTECVKKRLAYHIYNYTNVLPQKGYLQSKKQPYVDGWLGSIEEVVCYIWFPPKCDFSREYLRLGCFLKVQYLYLVV